MSTESKFFGEETGLEAIVISYFMQGLRTLEF